MWEGNKSQAGSLECIILDGAKRILGCSCNEAVRGDMGLDMQSRRDRAKLKWWYKLATIPEDKYPKHCFVWNSAIFFCSVCDSSIKLFVCDSSIKFWICLEFIHLFCFVCDSSIKFFVCDSSIKFLVPFALHL